MATIRLVPSTYYLSNTSYLTISDATNMYNNTDNGTYATVTNTRTGTSSYYIYVRGFNFNSIPSNAIVSSFTIKLKARQSGVSTSTSYKPYLADGTSAINGTCDVITTTVTTYTFAGLSADWDDIVNYGNDFGIRINCRRASRNTTSYMYIYGAEILVNYTLPIYHDITTINTANNITVSPLGTTSVNESSDFTTTFFTSDINKYKITDNNININNQLVHYNGTSADYSIETRGNYGFMLSNNYYTSQNKGIDKSCAVCRINFNLIQSATVTIQYINYAEAAYDFGVFGNIDVALTTNYYPAGSNGATISETSYKKACNTSADNTTTVQTLTYTNVSAGQHFIDIKFSKDDASAGGNDTLQFQISITYDQAVNYYTYTITNVTADHTIIISSATTIFVKENGSWVAYSKIYKKINGVWVEQTDSSSIFSPNTKYNKHV